MGDFKRERHNPIELIKMLFPNVDVSHIHYDSNMKACDRDYWRIEQSGGDGTSTFTLDMLRKVLLPLVTKVSYYNKTPIDILEKTVDIEYTIGDIWHCTVYGMFYLKCSEDHKYHGQRERVRIPVKCEYVLEE